MRPISVAFATLIVLAPGVLAQAPSVETMKAVLPAALEGPSAAWDGHYAYIFGGWDGTKRSDAILRYSPGTDTLLQMSAKLPTGRFGTAAVFVNGIIYVMGGYGCPEGAGQFCDEILRFDPAIDTISVMSEVKLPRARYYQAAATDGKGNIHIFGGENHTERSQIIFVFDTIAKRTGFLPEPQFPEGRAQEAVVFDGTNYLVFGGVDADSDTHADIWKYEPVSKRLTKLDAQLPRKAQGLSAVWDGTSAYLLGGQDYPRELDTISRFDPATSKVTLLSAKLPVARLKAAAIWDGQHAFVFGGYLQDEVNIANSQRLADIVRFTPGAASSEPTQSFVPPDQTGGKGIAGPDAMIAIALVAVVAALAARRRA